MLECCAPWLCATPRGVYKVGTIVHISHGGVVEGTGCFYTAHRSGDISCILLRFRSDIRIHLGIAMNIGIIPHFRHFIPLVAFQIGLNGYVV